MRLRLLSGVTRVSNVSNVSNLSNSRKEKEEKKVGLHKLGLLEIRMMWYDR